MLYTLVGQVGWAASLFVVGVLVARLLGPGPRGEAYLALLFPTIASLIATLGITWAFTFRLARHPEDLRRVLALIHLLTAGTAVLSLTAAFALAPVIGPVIGVSSDLVAAAMLLTPLLLYILLMLSAMSAIGRFRARAGVLLTQSTVYLVVTWALLAAGGSAMSVIAGHAVGLVVASVAAMAVLFPLAARSPHAAPGSSMRSLLVFGLKGHPGLIGQVLTYRLDAFVLGAFHGPVAVGFYAVATSLAEITGYGANAVSIAAGPRAVRADGRVLLARFTRLTVVSTGVLAIALALTAPALVPLVYGTDFSASVGPLLVLLPGVVALVYVKMLSVGLVAEGRPDLVTVGAFLSLGVTLAADLVLIPPFEATGAAAASTLAYSVGAVSIAFWYIRSADIAPRSLVPRATDLRGVIGMLHR